MCCLRWSSYDERSSLESCDQSADSVILYWDTIFTDQPQVQCASRVCFVALLHPRLTGSRKCTTDVDSCCRWVHFGKWLCRTRSCGIVTATDAGIRECHYADAEACGSTNCYAAARRSLDLIPPGYLTSSTADWPSPTPSSEASDMQEEEIYREKKNRKRKEGSIKYTFTTTPPIWGLWGVAFVQPM